MSEYRLVLQPVAANDIAEAHDWYESQREGLGSEFLDEIQKAFLQLQSHPMAFRVMYGEYRQSIVRRFPYVIHYHVEGDRVSVVGVFHGHRDPQTWRDRIDEFL